MFGLISLLSADREKLKEGLNMATTKSKSVKKTTTGKIKPAKTSVKKATLQSKPKPAAATTGTRKTTMNKKSLPPVVVSHGDIAERAYLLWQQEGCHHGQDWNHWFQAETQLRRETSALK